MIKLTVTIEVDGRAKNIQVDSLTPGDFVTGGEHILREYFEPMAEIVMHAYRELSDQDNPAIRDMLDDRVSISRRLAKIGMI